MQPLVPMCSCCFLSIYLCLSSKLLVGSLMDVTISATHVGNLFRIMPLPDRAMVMTLSTLGQIMTDMSEADIASPLVWTCTGQQQGCDTRGIHK